MYIFNMLIVTLHSRFTGKIDITYKIEAQTYSKVKARAIFKGSLPNQPHIIEREMKLHEQTNTQFKCREHLVYIDVSAQYFDITYEVHMNVQKRLYIDRWILVFIDTSTTDCEIPANSKVLHETKCKQVMGYAEGNFPDTTGVLEYIR